MIFKGIILGSLICLQSAVSIGRGTGALASASGTCALTGATYQWPVYNAANTCGTGVACTNGAGINTLASIATANNATQATTASQPIYTTGQVNGLPAMVFNGTSDVLTLATGIGLNQPTITWYSVVKPTSAATNQVIVGGSVTGSFEWAISSTKHQEIVEDNVVVIGTGTATISSTAYTTLVAQYTLSTGAWQLYTCSGGTCTSDGSGTTTLPGGMFTNDTNTFGYTTSADGYSTASIAEIGYFNTITLSNIAGYSSCKYAI